MKNGEDSIRDLLDVIGNKWSYLILLALAKRQMRFGEFRAEVDDISQRALTQTLRNLRRDGIVARDLFPTTPPSVRYRLTELGQSLVGPVQLLEHWAIEHMVAILQHREVCDTAQRRAPAPLE